MHNIKYFFILIVILGFYNCEKVIDIDLRDGDKVPVIDAQLDAADGELRITITKTAAYLSDNANPAVENAQITLIQPTGEEVQVPHQNGGIYQLSLTPQIGGTYTLEVSIDDELYTATTKLLTPKPIIAFVPFEFPAGGPPPEVGRLLGAAFQDPADTLNYYQVLHSVNDTFIENIQVVTDRGFNGRENVEVLFVQGVSAGDSVSVELRNVTFDTYRYYNALSDIQGGGTTTAAPGNPPTNWDNGAIGIFQAYAKTEDYHIIQ